MACTYSGRVKIVIFGLSVSSSWGNGHATLWRGLLRALAERGHFCVFYERDVPYYAQNRDLFELPGGRLVLYREWEEVRSQARKDLRDAEVSVVTSYCPDANVASPLLLSQSGLHVFYDLDTPVTLDGITQGNPAPYLPQDGLGAFDLVLSYTGGEALRDLRRLLGARRVAPLYGSVDPESHAPAQPSPEFAAALSYLGTYAADRQAALETLLLEPARKLPSEAFLIAGAQYPQPEAWPANVRLRGHVPPQQHSSFYSSARLNLSITRAAMARMGYCPSGRLFEAAACAAPVLTDSWAGLEQFFEPGREILVAQTTAEAMDALQRSAPDLRAIGRAARGRVLEQHTAMHRAIELEAALEAACEPAPAGAN